MVRGIDIVKMLVKSLKITGKMKFEHNNSYLMIQIAMFNILYDSGFLLEISIYLYHCFLPTSMAMLTEYSIDNKALL